MTSKSTPSRQLKPSLVVGIGALIGLSIILNAVTLGWQVKKRFQLRRRTYSYLNDDLPRDFDLPLRTVNLKFHDDPHHFALTGHTAWAEWNELRPNGKGFAYLGDAYYAIEPSIWHQQHCLNHVRSVLLAGEDTSDHTEHCFHYLRQAILCGADTTLEYAGNSIPNGGNVTHTCRDWKQLYDHLEEESAKWTPEMRTRFSEASDGTNAHSAHGKNLHVHS